MASSAWRWVACTRSRGAGGAGSYPLAALAARALVAGRPGRARRARLAALAARALLACTHAHVTHDTRHTHTTCATVYYDIYHRYVPTCSKINAHKKCSQNQLSIWMKSSYLLQVLLHFIFCFTVLALSTKESFNM